MNDKKWNWNVKYASESRVARAIQGITCTYHNFRAPRQNIRNLEDETLLTVGILIVDTLV
jgi:hypothetical protein